LQHRRELRPVQLVLHCMVETAGYYRASFISTCWTERRWLVRH